MKNKKNKKINLKSDFGATMTDVVIAIIIITIFTGAIGGAFYSSYKETMQSRVTELATSYAIGILEDIDKISYDRVINGMENDYIEKYDIPDIYTLSIDVSNYNEDNQKKDLIKKVILTLSYEFAQKEEKIVIEKMKVKEI